MTQDTGKNPWTRLASREVYRNPWIRVREDRVLNPNGGEGIYGLVQFHNRAVAILPIDDEGHTWLVGQYRYATDGYSWELPMGGHPRGQDPREGALRELREETGLVAGRLTELMRCELSNSVSDELGVAYVAQQLEQHSTAFDPTEALRLKRLPFDEALAMAIDGSIRDLLSVAAIQQLALRRDEFGV